VPRGPGRAIASADRPEMPPRPRSRTLNPHQLVRLRTEATWALSTFLTAGAQVIRAAEINVVRVSPSTLGRAPGAPLGLRHP
jgi:hypothetical protein